MKSLCRKQTGEGQQFNHYNSQPIVNICKPPPPKRQEQQTPVHNSNKQTMGKETYKCFAVIYLPCSVIESQQVLLSAHSHSYWKRETRDVVYARASGLIFICFNPKMPIHRCARHISTCLTMCNQEHLFNPNERRPAATTEANALCLALPPSQTDEPHTLLLSGTQILVDICFCLCSHQQTPWSARTWKHRTPASPP